MGSGASTDFSRDSEPSMQGTNLSRSSPVPRSLITRRRSSSQPADPSQNKPIKRRATNNETPVKMSTTDATTKRKSDNLATRTNDNEDDDLIPSAKSSFESDDVAAFETFCGEIDRVLEGHDSVVEVAAHRRKSSVCSSVAPGVQVGAPAERAPSESLRATVHHQQHHVDRPAFPTQENKQDPHFYPQHLTHLEHRHQNAHHHQQQQQQQQQITKPTPSMPPLAAKSLEKPISVWKRPEDLAHKEQALRDRYQDTWFPRRTEVESESTAYSSGTSQSRRASEDGGSEMRKRQNLDHQPFWDERKETKWAEPPLQEKKDFDISKFKAANKKKNGHKVDKLLPATYRGYNASLSRQGTLPSLHRGSISTTVSSSGTPASEKQGSSAFDNSKELKYNPSEEALLDFIEKEFS